jgi:Na+-driven multidrug efflux pump
LNILFIMYFISVERAGFAQVLSLLRGIGIVIPLAVILSGAMGMAGIWLAMPVTECIVLVIALAGLRRKGR